MTHRAEAENDLQWRIEELSYYGSLLNNIEEVDKNKVYRMIITMFYAHYEGYSYFLFNLYARHINEQNIACSLVKPAIAAASLAGVFHDLRNTSRSPVHATGKDYPKDILQVARDTEFLENLAIYLSKAVAIPDRAISTDSNLKMHVLKPILFRLGFSETYLDNLSSDITTLVNYRNETAHGYRTKPITKQEYDKLRQKTLDLMIDLRDAIIEGIEYEKYLIAN